jgi:hypothetical protein
MGIVVLSGVVADEAKAGRFDRIRGVTAAFLHSVAERLR